MCMIQCQENCFLVRPPPEGTPWGRISGQKQFPGHNMIIEHQKTKGVNAQLPRFASAGGHGGLPGDEGAGGAGTMEVSSDGDGYLENDGTIHVRNSGTFRVYGTFQNNGDG